MNVSYFPGTLRPRQYAGLLASFGGVRAALLEITSFQQWPRVAIIETACAERRPVPPELMRFPQFFLPVLVDRTVRWQKPVPGILEQPEIDRLGEGVRGSADLNRTAWATALNVDSRWPPRYQGTGETVYHRFCGNCIGTVDLPA